MLFAGPKRNGDACERKVLVSARTCKNSKQNPFGSARPVKTPTVPLRSRNEQKEPSFLGNNTAHHSIHLSTRKLPPLRVCIVDPCRRSMRLLLGSLVCALVSFDRHAGDHSKRSPRRICTSSPLMNFRYEWPSLSFLEVACWC